MAFSYLEKWLEKQHIRPIFWWNKLKKIVWGSNFGGIDPQKRFSCYSVAEWFIKIVFRIILSQKDPEKMFFD